MKSYNKINIQLITETGLMLALSIIIKLSIPPLILMPQGGDVTLAMIPLIIFTIRWGALKGILIGGLYGIISLIIQPTIIHPLQIILDYPLPSMAIGLSGIQLIKNNKLKLTSFVPSIILAYILKYIAHFLSGYIFFSEYAPEEWSAINWSLYYNLTYNLPELVLVIVVIALLNYPLKEYIKKQY